MLAHKNIDIPKLCLYVNILYKAKVLLFLYKLLLY